MSHDDTNTTAVAGPGLSEWLGASIRGAQKPRKRRQLFPGERWV